MNDEPGKEPKTKRPPRRINGAGMDVTTCSVHCGWSEKKTWRLVDRKLIPFRRLGGRIIFLRAEIEQWLQGLDGCNLAEARNNLEQRQ
jgi:hypothetical protein